MDLPKDEVFYLLLAIHTGQCIEPVDGNLAITLPHRDGGTLVIEEIDAEFDLLEDLGWITTETDPPTATEQGRYALELWAKRRLKKKRPRASAVRMGVFK